MSYKVLDLTTGECLRYNPNKDAQFFTRFFAEEAIVQVLFWNFNVGIKSIKEQFEIIEIKPEKEES